MLVTETDVTHALHPSCHHTVICRMGYRRWRSIRRPFASESAIVSTEQVERLGISGPEFEELVTAIPARKQFHVLDACNAGAINTAFGIRGAGEEIALSRLGRATGSALIAASRDDQFAQEFETLGQGALTRAVLDGLGGAASGDDDEITVGELKSYVENAVPGLTEEHTGQAQYPTGFVFGQDFPVGLR